MLPGGTGGAGFVQALHQGRVFYRDIPPSFIGSFWPSPDNTSDIICTMQVVARGANEGFSLTKAEEDELLAAMAEIERGEYVTLEDLLQSLPQSG
jgi:hypothetical protein